MKTKFSTKISLFSLSAIAFSSFAFAFANVSHYEQAKAEEELAIKSDTDSFALLDKQYAADESFVYTADLHFKSGQAGGIAFGSQENDHYYVLNMDRIENRVKLLYFASNGAGGYNPTELRNDYFIGNDKITDSELSVVKPQVAGLENVNLKVILTIEDAHAYAEFYIEGIKRFGVDSVIDLNDMGASYHYEGGYLGMNCFNADVYLSNIEIGKSDYSYFSELYRNQYHLQPFAKWSNDPNALCYYDGYYHVYYQTNPFGQLWGSMYWGHARSRDLIHFEFLPICLFPDTDAMGFGPGVGYMWSGCAITYKKGMSMDVDALNWFPNGGGSGMMAIFTRDGGLQDQIIISSDDGGLTWSKRIRIPQTTIGYDYKVDWRDPKIFPIAKDGNNVILWGMTLSSYNLNKGWFLKSTNLLNWSVAGEFAFPTPECIGVGFLKDQNNNEYAYLTNKSRTYILGNLSYNGVTGKVEFCDQNGVDISTYSLEEMPLQPLDYGPDSYASQSFYINDPASEFNGKDIVLNWFSGDLNASFCTGPGEYANLRSRWNGGFTIPVEYGVKETSEGVRLTQKPITVNNSNLAKSSVVNIENQTINAESENPLKDVHTHVFEMSASIKTNNHSSITFKVDVGDNEYMQLGWNAVDGYYVDRTYLDDKGINTNIDWHTKYASHLMGDSDVKTFYVLSDNGGLEVFCEDYSISFYFVTTASIYSTGASLKADNAVINSLSLNQVDSVYRTEVAADEGVLYVSNTDVELDTNFSLSRFITCWFSGASPLAWEVLENEDVVEYVTSNQGINLTAKKAGTASFKVSAGGQEKIINVTVYDAFFESDFTFSGENVVSGNWIMSTNMISGEMMSGNAFLLTNESGSDFTYTGKFDIIHGTAGALVFRASSDMSQYLVTNYDANEGVAKLWSTHGELARSGHLSIGLTDIVISVKASDKDINIIVNGNNAINYTLQDNEPLSGRFGLNVFSGKAQFKTLSLVKENYEYSSGELAVNLSVDQFITDVYNVTKGNVRLEPGFYYQSNGTLYIKESYFSLLENGRYQFKIVGASYAFNIFVEVNASHAFIIEDMTIESGVNVNIYIGNTEVTSLKINDVEISNEKYSIKDYTLTIAHDCFKLGDNTVVINDEVTFNVEIVSNDDVIINKETKVNYVPLIVGLSVGGFILVAAGVLVPVLIITSRKKGKK